MMLVNVGGQTWVDAAAIVAIIPALVGADIYLRNDPGRIYASDSPADIVARLANVEEVEA